MNGATALLQTAADAGCAVCFANPGTTEMPLVAALDAVPAVRAVLGLFEGVCTGAADGYARMTDRPALTLLHLGPGFANGIANLHNARRAYSPVVNLIGDHASWHVAADPPLASDIESLARPVSRWVHTSVAANALPQDVARAIEASLSGERGAASLVLPADFQATEGAKPVRVALPQTAAADEAAIEVAARSLRDAERPVLLLGGRALRRDALRSAARVATATGARLVAEVFPARWERGAGLPPAERLPYFPEQAVEFLAPSDAVVLAGAAAPIAFFGYEGTPGELAPAGTVLAAFGPEHDAAGSLAALADLLAAPATVEAPAAALPEAPAGPLTTGTLGAALARALPEDAIVVDEAATSGLPFLLQSYGAAPHALLSLTGGAIGQGLPVATGAAIACPQRKVVAFQADGSGAYTLQALWTMVREQLDVVVLLCSNRAYRILQIELGRAGISEPGPAARSLTKLDAPTLDWCALARGFGVPAERTQRIDDSAALTRALESAFAESGPHFLELVL
jgi:acetolactate synthase-1/2/3 large subunit